MRALLLPLPKKKKKKKKKGRGQGGRLSFYLFLLYSSALHSLQHAWGHSLLSVMEVWRRASQLSKGRSTAILLPHLFLFLPARASHHFFCYYAARLCATHCTRTALPRAHILRPSLLLSNIPLSSLPLPSLLPMPSYQHIS